MRIAALVGLCGCLSVLSPSFADGPDPMLSPVAAPTPAPIGDDARWTANVQTLAGVLNGTIDPALLRNVITSHAWMSPFERNRSESASALMARLPTRNVVSVRSYIHPAVTCATDIVADVNATTNIADSVRKQLVPTDNRDLRQADATMARWFASALDAQEGDPVAIITLYDDGRSSNAPPQLYFVLIRGELGATDGQPRVSRVLYGTLDSAAR